MATIIGYDVDRCEESRAGWCETHDAPWSITQPVCNEAARQNETSRSNP